MLSWTRYTVVIRFRDRLVGGVPIAAPETDREKLYGSWQRGQQVESDGTSPTLTETLVSDEDMPVDELTGQGFKRDQDGLYIEARQVKAMLKEAAQRLGIVKNVRGSRQVLQHDLHVRALDGGQKIHVGRDEPDGVDERPISVITPQGPRTSLKRYEYITEPELAFEIRLLAGGIGNGLIDADTLHDMLELGSELGLGADRSQGEGTFDLVSIQQPSESEPPKA